LCAINMGIRQTWFATRRIKIFNVQLFHPNVRTFHDKGFRRNG
jgi:hypothetical protein